MVLLDSGDIQINDTHFHNPLKREYRDLECKKSLEKLEATEGRKTPGITKEETIEMVVL